MYHFCGQKSPKRGFFCEVKHSESEKWSMHNFTYFQSKFYTNGFKWDWNLWQCPIYLTEMVYSLSPVHNWKSMVSNVWRSFAGMVMKSAWNWTDHTIHSTVMRSSAPFLSRHLPFGMLSLVCVWTALCGVTGSWQSQQQLHSFLLPQ